jgi:hypothetical protein
MSMTQDVNIVLSFYIVAGTMVSGGSLGLLLACASSCSVSCMALGDILLCKDSGIEFIHSFVHFCCFS